MNLRPYQTDAVASIVSEWNDHQATLLVLPTGTGKTIVFAKILEQRAQGRGVVLAHREELIRQAVDKIKRATALSCSVELADERSYEGTMLAKSDVLVSSIQTQNAMYGRDAYGKKLRRMSRFRPHEFGSLVVDEAHHATADSYRRVLDHYTQNREIKILGVTATPDRHDEEALGKVFQSVAMVYEINDAVTDGWLVEPKARSITIKGLDYSGIRTTAGDLNGADLARVMEYEKNLHEIAAPTFEIAKGRKTLVFAASVAHAERLCEIFNRWSHGCARFVTGTTPKDVRREMFRDYAHGKFSFLINVGVATEGFDEPGIEYVVMARPTKSRALFSQMLGRGTRPLAGVVDGIEDAVDRRRAIAHSDKTHLSVLDFVGNAGKHKLVTSMDVLGGNYDDEVLEKAKKIVRDTGKDESIEDALKKAEHLVREMRERAKRQDFRPRAQWTSTEISPFAVLDVTPWRQRGWDKGKQPTPKMLAFLDKSGVNTAKLTFTQARQIIGKIIERRDANKATFKQIKWLRKFGHDDAAEMSFDEASRRLDECFRNKPRKPRAMAVRR